MQTNMDVVPMRLLCAAGFDCINAGIAAAMAKNSRRFTASILRLLFLVRRIYRTSKLPAKSSEECGVMRSIGLVLLIALTCTSAVAQRPSDPALLVPQNAPELDYI